MYESTKKPQMTYTIFQDIFVGSRLFCTLLSDYLGFCTFVIDCRFRLTKFTCFGKEFYRENPFLTTDFSQFFKQEKIIIHFVPRHNFITHGDGWRFATDCVCDDDDGKICIWRLCCKASHLRKCSSGVCSHRKLIDKYVFSPIYVQWRRTYFFLSA